jgi:general L-amino acid transport system permease protein
MNGAGVTWLRRNLFATPLDIALSLVTIPAVVALTYGLIRWMTVFAGWNVVRDSLPVLLVGTLPANEWWLACVVTLLLCSMIGVLLGVGFALRWAHVLAVGLVLVVICLIWGRLSPAVWTVLSGIALLGSWCACSAMMGLRRHVGWIVAIELVLIATVLADSDLNAWGGLLLSMLITVFSSVFIIAFGILLALGRRSRFAIVRWCCIAYIEVMRSLPLILIVFWIWLATPLLVPHLDVPSAIRGIAGFDLYFAATAAEFVRSGLQAVPRGQVEAAMSLGLRPMQVNYSIVLPEALRAALPGLVGNILDVFNFVPVVFIIGLCDFMRAGEMILASPQYSNRTYEVYFFIFAVYFAIGSTITLISRGLEHRLNKGSGRN